MSKPIRWIVAGLVAAGGSLFASSALATPQLQYVYGGSAGTVVFIHGKSDCSTVMGDCNSADAVRGPNGYWSNSSNSATLANEGTIKVTSTGTQYYEAFTIGYDLANQGYWYSANDVGGCLRDLYQGTNWSGCNPNLYQRSSFHIVTHSAGGTIIDRLLSNDSWFGINAHIQGWVVSLAPALAGSRASSALYGVDGYGGWCSSLVSWLAGWSLKNNGAASLTRGAVTGQANGGLQGRTPRWILKVTTTGGSWSANNDGCGTIWGGTTVREDDNDCQMGALAGCLGYSSSDDMDGLLYWSDSDPTNNPWNGANGCPTNDSSCHYYAAYSGAYWHWFESWANHSHSRDDAYTTLGDWQTVNGCNYRSPGTCVGQYGLN